MARVYVTGAVALRKQLEALDAAVDPRHLKPVLARALKILMDSARAKLLSQTQRTPESEFARKNAKREGGGKGKWTHIEDAFQVKESKGNIAMAFSKVMRWTAPHGLWIEYGHYIKRGTKGATAAMRHFLGQGSKRTFGFVPARPFFRPALDEKKAQMREQVKTEINALLLDAINEARGIPESFGADETGWVG